MTDKLAGRHATVIGVADAASTPDPAGLRDAEPRLLTGTYVKVSAGELDLLTKHRVRERFTPVST